MEPVKPGYQTTEFWITMLVLGLAAAFGVPGETPWQARVGLFFGAVASGLAYKWSRTSVKNNAADVGEETKPHGFVRLPLLLALLVAAALASCAYVQATAGALKTCVGREVAAADWNELKDLANSALRLDGQSALANLSILAMKHGGLIVDCVVTELRSEYLHRVAATAGAGVQKSGGLEDERALTNADKWLTRSVQR